MKEEEARATATVLLTMLNTAAANMAGPDAVMNSFERALIEPSFIRTLQKGGAASEKITQIVDPLALMVGMTMWGSRVLGVRTQKLAVARAGYAPAPDSEPVFTQAPDVSPAGTTLNGHTVDDIIAHVRTEI